MKESGCLQVIQVEGVGIFQASEERVKGKRRFQMFQTARNADSPSRRLRPPISEKKCREEKENRKKEKKGKGPG